MLNFKARFLVREEEEKKKEERRRKKNAPTETVAFSNRTHRNFLLLACVETPHSDLGKGAMGSPRSLGLREKLYKLKGDLDENRATAVSLSEVRCLPAPSTIKRKEREFVVDSGSLHAHAEQERFRCSRTGNCESIQNPTKVITANGEVHTNEEATVYVKDLDSVVTQDSPTVPSLRQLCEDHGYWVDLWSKAASLKQRKIPCNTENYVPTIVPSLSSGSSSSSAASLTTTSSSQDSKQVNLRRDQ